MDDYRKLVAHYHRLCASITEVDVNERLHILINHPTLQEYVIALGINLSKVLLTLLTINTELTESQFQRLKRYSKQNRIQDLPEAIIFLSEKNILINERSFNYLLDKTPKGESFLPAARIFSYGKALALIDEQNSMDYEFSRMEGKYIRFYDALAKNGLMITPVFKHLGYHSPPKYFDTIDAVIRIYKKLYHYDAITKVHESLETHRKNSLYDNVSLQGLANNLDLLEKRMAPTQEVMIVYCLVPSFKHKELGRVLNRMTLQTPEHCPLNLFFNHLRQYYHETKLLQDFYQLIDFLCAASVSNEIRFDLELINQYKNFEKFKREATQSFQYLSQCSLMNQATYQLLTDYYPIQAQERLRKDKERTSALAPEKIIEMLSLTNLAPYTKAVFECIHTKLASCIETAFYVNELNEERLNYLLTLPATDKQVYKTQEMLATLHLPASFLNTSSVTEIGASIDTAQLLLAFKNIWPQLLPEHQDLLKKQPTVLIEIENQFRQFHQDLSSDMLSLILSSLISLDLTHLCEQQIISTCLKHFLDWSEADIHLLDVSHISKDFVVHTQQLKTKGLLLNPTQYPDNNWIVIELCHGKMLTQHLDVITFLFQKKQLAPAYWKQIEKLSSQEGGKLLSALAILDQHELCMDSMLNHLFAHASFILGADILVQLHQHQISASDFYAKIMQHTMPSLACKGIVHLNNTGNLTVENANKILACQRPDLVSGIILQLVEHQEDINQQWKNLINLQQPQKYIAFIKQYKDLTEAALYERLSPAIVSFIHQNAISQSTLYFAYYLTTSLDITDQYILKILASIDVENIVYTLEKLLEHIRISPQVIEIVMRNPSIFKVLEENFMLPDTEFDEALLIKILEDPSQENTKNIIKLNASQKQFSHVRHRLEQTFYKMPCYRRESFLNDIDALEEAGFTIDESIFELFSRQIQPSNLIKLSQQLKRDQCYSEAVINQFIACGDSNIRAANVVASKSRLNTFAIQFLTVEKNFDEIVCLGLLASRTDLLPNHVIWVKMIFDNMKEDEQEGLLCRLFKKLNEKNLLSSTVMEGLINCSFKNRDRIFDIAHIIDDIPTTIFDMDILKAIFDFFNQPPKSYNTNPLSTIVEIDPALLTKQNIMIALSVNADNAFDVYKMITDLRTAGIDDTQVIKECRSLDTVTGYIILHNAKQLTVAHRQLLLCSHYPSRLAKLIVTLADHHLYNKHICTLLSEQNHREDRSAFKHKSYSCVLKDIIDAMPEINTDMVAILLQAHLNWSKLHDILEKINSTTLNRHTLLLIINSDLNYLVNVISYINKLLKRSEVADADLIRCCQYQTLLNQPPIIEELQNFKKNDSSDADQSEARHILNSLWTLCAMDNVAAILTLLATGEIEELQTNRPVEVANNPAALYTLAFNSPNQAATKSHLKML